MKRILIALLCLLATPALAQKSKSTLFTDINTNFPNNTSGRITPTILRSTLTDIVNSYFDLNGGTSLNCAASRWVSALPTLSSITCTQPAISDISGMGAGISAWLVTPSSANLLAAMTTKTGTGSLVFNTSPAISTGFTLSYITGSTQCLHVDTAGVVTGTGVDCGSGGGGTPGGSSGQVQYNNAGAFGGFTTGGDATINTGTGALTLATVNGNVGTFGSATTCITTTANAKGLITAISAATCTPALGSITGFGTGVATALGVNTGSAGAFVLFNGALGTPSSGTLTNATGLPVAGITGLGTGVGTALGVNVGSAGAPVLFNGAGGTPTALVGTNITGTAAGLTAGTASAVAVGGITGLGTGVGAALATNVGSAGAPVLFNGAGGTPSAVTLTNGTGLPLSDHTTQAAWSFVVNNTSGAAAPTAVDIPSFTLKGTPVGTDLVVISDQAASGALKRATISSIAGAGAVTSIAGNTGAFTLGPGLMNATNDLQVLAGTVIGTSITTSATNASLAATTPIDDTIPQITEGNQIITANYTPKFSNSILLVTVSGQIGIGGTGDNAAIALHNGAANAFQAEIVLLAASARVPFSVTGSYSPGSTSAQTISCRIGAATQPVSVNGNPSGRFFGGSSLVVLTIQEIKQ